MMSNMLVISVIFTTIFCCSSTTNIDEQTTIIDKNDAEVTIINKQNEKYFNYLRLSEGECFNCSTYKCTNHKGNLGGSDWCIMLFSDAIAHCNSDVNCGGYTMSTAEWFHQKYDKNGQVAVHLSKAEVVPCPVPEWSSYEKQKTIRTTPIIYGRTTCEDSDESTCAKLQNYKYIFVNNSNTVSSGTPYLCNTYTQDIDKKNPQCILPIVDAVNLCNSDDQCEGFMINTDNNWQNSYLNNGMQSVQLFGKGVTYTPSQTWRTFKKQY